MPTPAQNAACRAITEPMGEALNLSEDRKAAMRYGLRDGWTANPDYRQLAAISSYCADAIGNANAARFDPPPSSTYQPHAPILATWLPGRCAICTLSIGNPVHVLALPGMESASADRADHRAAAQGQTLTAAMREPIRDISVTAGQMERNSPLFYGTGSNPTLFG